VSPSTPPTPPPVAAAIHGPYEDLAIEGLRLIEKLIDGQTADQKATIWKQWIDFWNALANLAKGVGS